MENKLAEASPLSPPNEKCALFGVVLLCPLTVETYEEVSSLRKELPNG